MTGTSAPVGNGVRCTEPGSFFLIFCANAQLVGTAMLDMDHLALLRNATSIDGAIKIAKTLAEKAGFDQFLYGFRLPVLQSEPHEVFYSNYAEKDWLPLYQEKGFYPFDVTIQHVMSNALPAVWTPQFRAASPGSANMFLEAKGNGVSCGITIPVRGAHGDVGMVNFVTREQVPDHFFDFKRIAAISMMSAVLHDVVVSRYAAGQIHLPLPQHIKLSAREKECLRWIADGKVYSAISDLMGITQRTVAYHVENATAKLHAATGQQAVARAVGLRLLTVG